MIFVILIVSIFYLYFLLQIYRGLGCLKPTKVDTDNKIKATVIVPFRNESYNILNSLISLENQKYPKELYEVIYIDDNSDDDSYEKLNNASKNENIKLFRNNDSQFDRAHKKRAIELGIKESKNEIIILTDADCTHDPDWLGNLLSSFDEQTGFVSGPVEFLSDGSLFQELQQLEFSSLIISGAGLIGSGSPAICNAANLGFRKKVFYEVGGYEDNKNLSSGDDEFLMQKISLSSDYKVKFCIGDKVIVQTDPNKNISSFIQQRRRWASKGFYYKNKLLVVKLVAIFLFYLAIPLAAFGALFLNPEYWLILTYLLTVKIIGEYFILRRGQILIFRISNLKYFLFAEILHIPYIIFSTLLGVLGSYSWKGRKVQR